MAESSPKPKLRPKKSIGEKVKDFADKYNLTGPPTPATKAAQERFLSRDAPSRQGGLPSLANTNSGNLGGLSKQNQYKENLRRYNEYLQSQGQLPRRPGGKGALTVAPQRPDVTPEMRKEALNIFESQQGAGQVPYYMAAARRGPNASPAFNYAAQNYDVLGGSQRIAPRPMEMMSVAERQRINDMAQGMADQQAAEDDYQAGMDMVMRGGGKGGGKGGPRTGPQLPPPGMIGLPRTPDYGGGSPNPIQGQPSMPPRFGGKGRGGFGPTIPGMVRPFPRTPDYGGQRSPFASILASRFGGFGGQ